MNTRRYKYSLEYIGIHDTSKGFHLTGNPLERLICCDEVQFNMEVACDILNELNEENLKIKNEIQAELEYLENKAMDNPVNQGRIRALKDLQRLYL